MAQILSDSQIKRLLGSIIVRGDENKTKPNSYVLRLGSEGRFLSTGKKFELRDGKGIKIQPGEAVAVTSLEDIDLSQETVDKVFPGKQLHGFLTPTTDFAREGVVAATTQIDAGFHGTLNWTLSNYSSEEIPIVYGTGIYRLTFFLLDKDEKPDELYSGHYQSKFGYVSSHRPGPPRGMKEEDFETSEVSDDMSELFEQLSKSSWPYNIIGSRLAMVDDQFKVVAAEYKDIKHSLDELAKGMGGLRKDSSKEMKALFQVETYKLTLRFIMSFGGLIGVALTIFGKPEIQSFLSDYGWGVGLLVIFVSVAGFWLAGKSKPSE